MAVEVVFDDVTSQVTLPKFRPVQRDGGSLQPCSLSKAPPEAS
jgi:hypothetical protein